MGRALSINNKNPFLSMTSKSFSLFGPLLPSPSRDSLGVFDIAIVNKLTLGDGCEVEASNRGLCAHSGTNKGRGKMFFSFSNRASGD
jgi:hypothetical protein